ncbi:ABC transporter ATP-binding protein [soil metagenome]
MSDAAVSISKLEMVFGGQNPVRALDQIDLTIKDGEFAAILGPSGCGKSTLLNLIAGFETPTAGELLFYGRPVKKAGPDRAVVFQEPALFPWLSVWENVVFGPKAQGRHRRDYEDDAARYLELVGLAGFHRHLPDQLSGGMKQRVGIARCLVMEPKMFLMDEPFGALDAQTRLQMQELLLDVWEKLKKTVLFITHDIDESILLADVVFMMSARPGRMWRRIPISIPRPRSSEFLTDSKFNELRREIMLLLREQAGPPRAA